MDGPGDEGIDELDELDLSGRLIVARERVLFVQVSVLALHFRSIVLQSIR
jgi:hypothetical protein